MKIRYLFIGFLCIMLFFSCITNTRKEIASYDLFVDKSIAEYPDTSFFSEIRCMQYYNNCIYTMDVSRRDIAVLDTGFNEIRVIGRGGNGPGELTAPISFYICADSVYVVDGGTGRISTFLNESYIGSTPIDRALDKRFFYREGEFFVPQKSSRGLFLTKFKDRSDSCSYYGDLEKVGSEMRTVTMNGRDLLFAKDCFISVPDALPFIEKYDIKTKKLIQKYDLSGIEVFKNNIDFILKKDIRSDKSYYVLTRDSYGIDGHVFLLCSNYGDDYKARTIVRVSLYPEMKVIATYTLPADYYNSICVSKTHIYAFNALEAKIESFRYEF
ncbi:6-bladed beta-propeller [Bacteroides bouchesdurhonensis]|uniref:6-bladed beta-propeller n=1 Tax=Bacteroides bouchesdurhonensis TaxID=1841855 RepID=UPI0011DC9BCB|nr:6-bladed beta-propeller [Bacteroides bouchesdurhonensis]